MGSDAPGLTTRISGERLIHTTTPDGAQYQCSLHLLYTKLGVNHIGLVDISELRGLIVSLRRGHT